MEEKSYAIRCETVLKADGALSVRTESAQRCDRNRMVSGNHRSAANAETILHFMPLVKSKKREKPPLRLLDLGIIGTVIISERHLQAVPSERPHNRLQSLLCGLFSTLLFVR